MISVAYDRDVSGEDRKAMNCYEELQRRLTARGYYPYRLGIQSMDLLDADSARGAFLRSSNKLLSQMRCAGP